MLECWSFTFDGKCHTYAHTFPKRGVKPIEVHIHIISPFEIVLPIKMRRFSQIMEENLSLELLLGICV
jgi:hypothetical protein